MKIGITVRRDNLNYYIHRSYINYLDRFNLNYDFINLNSNLNNYDGFLICGGYDIDPKYYNQQNYASNNIDEEMDLLDKKVIEYAVNKNKPLLGICRGLQCLNVFLGGTLKQDICNHSNENHFIYFKNKYHLVNSFHHQSIDKLAKDLIVLAKSLDNEIEIIKHKTLNIYGVQFHPELINFNYNFFNEI